MCQCSLTHCGMAKPYGKMNMGRHWLRQWLVAWRHQVITWTNVDFHMWGSLTGIRLRAISERVPKLLLFMMCENCSFLIYRHILMRQWVNCICPEEMHSCTRYTFGSRKWVTTVLRDFLWSHIGALPYASKYTITLWRHWCEFAWVCENQ